MGLKPRQLQEYDLYGKGSGRVAHHEAVSFVGSEINSLLPLLENDFVTFAMLRESIRYWTGGEADQFGTPPSEFYLSRPQIIGVPEQDMPDAEVERLVRGVSGMMNPFISFDTSPQMIHSAREAFMGGVLIRDFLTRHYPQVQNWGLLLPGNIEFSAGSAATIKIDSSTGVKLDGRLWLPPSWEQIEMLPQYIEKDGTKGPPTYTFLAHLRPPCSLCVHKYKVKFVIDSNNEI